MGPDAFYGTSYDTPPVSYVGEGTPGTNPSGSEWANSSDMWYLPPGAAFFQNADASITQTAEGVNLGGIDLLEYMAMEPFTGMNMGGEFRV